MNTIFFCVIRQISCLLVGNRKSPSKSVLCKNDICVMDDTDIRMTQDVVLAKERKD